MGIQNRNVKDPSAVGQAIDSHKLDIETNPQGGTTTKTAFNRFYKLPMVATADLPTAAAANESGILYDSTTNTVKASNGSSWANIAASGVAENAFKTIDCPAGTDPVADSATDTLTLTATDATLVITGTAASDSIDFKLAALTSARILVGNSSNVATGVVMSGDATISNTGAVTVSDVTAGSDAQGDILVRGATTYAGNALRIGTAVQMLVVNAGATGLEYVSVSGDVALAQNGGTTVTDLTITGEAQGSVLYFNGTNWVRLVAGTSGYFLKTLGAGANPMWDVPALGTASSLANGCVLQDAGSLDATLSFTVQTVASPALTIPNFAGASDTFTFNTLAATLANKTLTAAKIVNGGFLADANGNEQLVFTTTASAVNYFQMTNSATASPATQEMAAAGSDDNIHCLLTAKGTGKVQVKHGSGAAVEVVNLSDTQTLSGKTLTAAKIVSGGFLADANGNEQLVFVTTATAVNYFQMMNSATASPATQTLAAAGSDTNIHCLLTAKGSGKVQAQHGGGSAVEIVTLSDTQALTGKTYEGLTITTSASGVLTIAAGKTLTVNNSLAFSGTDAQTFTFPAVSDTVAVLGTAQIFTASHTFEHGHFLLRDNIDTTSLQFLVDEVLTGARTFTLKVNDGNRVLNISGSEHVPVTWPTVGNASDTTYGVPITVVAYISNQAAAVNIWNANAPFKCRIVKAWSISTSAAGGTWKLNDGAVGLGNDITNAVAVAASIDDFDEPSDYVAAQLNIAAGGSLSIVPDVGGLLDCYVFVQVIREA